MRDVQRAGGEEAAWTEELASVRGEEEQRHCWFAVLAWVAEVVAQLEGHWQQAAAHGGRGQAAAGRAGEPDGAVAVAARWKGVGTPSLDSAHTQPHIDRHTRKRMKRLLIARRAGSVGQPCEDAASQRPIQADASRIRQRQGVPGAPRPCGCPPPPSALHPPPIPLASCRRCGSVVKHPMVRGPSACMLASIPMRLCICAPSQFRSIPVGSRKLLCVRHTRRTRGNRKKEGVLCPLSTT
jgi:hypothetical protein